MTELAIALNLTHEFSKITESGTALRPLRGPGHVGLINLGNSCYINSVLQVGWGGWGVGAVGRLGWWGRLAGTGIGPAGCAPGVGPAGRVCCGPGAPPTIPPTGYGSARPRCSLPRRQVFAGRQMRSLQPTANLCVYKSRHQTPKNTGTPPQVLLSLPEMRQRHASPEAAARIFRVDADGDSSQPTPAPFAHDSMLDAQEP
jgi:hypothetical protein